MRILSQDGKIDVNYDLGNLSIASGRYEDVERAGIYFHSCSCTNATRLAEYTSVEKARNAMEMLHEAYTGIPLILQNVDISDNVKEMFEKWKKQGICVVSENQPSKVEYVGNVLFQFPSDDEVEA